MVLLILMGVITLFQDLLNFIGRFIWECASRIIKDVTLWCPVVSHEGVALAHHLEVGPFTTNFGPPSFLGQFLRSDGDLGSRRELVDIFEVEIVSFTRIVLQVQDDGAYPLGFYDTPDSVDIRIIPWSQGFILCV